MQKGYFLGMCMIALLSACNSSDGQNTDPCGGRGVSRVPEIPNVALIRATVLDIRPNSSGIILNLHITESHDIGHEMNGAKVNTDIEVASSQLPDISVGDTITAFASQTGDECGQAWGIYSVIKVPNAIAGAPDTMTVTISGPSGTVTRTYTEGFFNSQGNVDPDLISYVTGSTLTQIQLHSGGTSTPGATVLSITVEGITPQSYTVHAGAPLNSLSYDVFDPQHQPYTGFFSSSSGTITLSDIGNVVDKITGAFDAVATDVTSTPTTIRISGTFSVTRDN